MTTLRAVIYLRQSSDLVGTGDAVERQRTDREKRRAAHGWATVQVVTNNVIRRLESTQAPLLPAPPLQRPRP